MRALDDIKVVDLTRVLAGPYCTRMLADMGAEVIKVEMPGSGDDARHYGPPFVNGESAYFMAINRNKQSVALNLKEEADREVFLGLVKASDVLVENFTPGTMESLGFGYDFLREENPRLVYASISGFGQSGPYRSRPGYDIVLQAMGGIMSITGPEDGKPSKVGISLSDITAGMFAAYGILCALHARERTGRGQLVDISMLDCQVAIQEPVITSFLANGQVPGRVGNRNPSISPFGVFQAADAEVAICAGNDALFARMCAALGLLELATDSRFASNSLRTQNYRPLYAAINQAISKLPASEVLARLEANGMPSGHINTLDKVVSDPQVLERRMIVEVDHPVAGNVKTTGNPVKLSDTPGDQYLPSPMLGQHNETANKQPT